MYDIAAGRSVGCAKFRPTGGPAVVSCVSFNPRRVNLVIGDFEGRMQSFGVGQMNQSQSRQAEINQETLKLNDRLVDAE